jgi:hypothetical protein
MRLLPSRPLVADRRSADIRSPRTPSAFYALSPASRPFRPCSGRPHSTHPAVRRKPCRHIPGTTLLHRRSSTAHAGVSLLASACPPEMWGSARGRAPTLTPRLSPTRPGLSSATEAQERGATARPSAGSWRHLCPSRRQPVPPIISPTAPCRLYRSRLSEY